MHKNLTGIAHVGDIVTDGKKILNFILETYDDGGGYMCMCTAPRCFWKEPT
jgi:hypothetical protein